MSRRVVVTGSASGIGKATAELLRSRGVDVVALDRNPQCDVRVDLSDPASIDEAVAAIGAVDGLCNVAGIPGEDGAELCMQVNYLGLRHLTTALVAANEGLAVASAASFRGAAWRSHLPLHIELARTSSFADGLDWVREHADEIAPDPYAWSK